MDYSTHTYNSFVVFSRDNILCIFLGDSYFVSALSTVVINEEIQKFVIPTDNLDNNGSGVYHFR